MKNLKKKIGSLTIASAIVITGGLATSLTTNLTQNKVEADSYAYGTQSKTVHSMYGDVKLTVNYKRNLVKKTSAITSIKSYSSTDSYLKLIDKHQSSSSAFVYYYDSTHKVDVRNEITSSECK